MGKDSEQLVSIMDTTLRDGEQTPDISYTPAEKLQIARMLLAEVTVDRIEIASTRVSQGEAEAARLITDWARKTDRLAQIEILGFCDGKKSVDWITQVGGMTLNLLTKGSEHHCRTQLRLTPEAHLQKIDEVVRYAKHKKVKVNVYLEDWSNGVRQSFDYVADLVRALMRLEVERIYLPDTLGIFAPSDIERYLGAMVTAWPQAHFEYHGHNDYGLATANCLAAVRVGARGIHTSVNGLGERAGNSRLAEVVAALHDHSPFRTRVNEERLTALSRLVETFTGKNVPPNAPIVGRDVFTQTAGVHADGDAKGELYASRLAPDRFGRKRRYALGKLSGKASLDHNLKNLGITLSVEDHEKVLRRIIELGDKKHTVMLEDLPMIIADVLDAPGRSVIRIESYRVCVGSNETPTAEIAVRFAGKLETASASGDGGYDAFMKALCKAVQPLGVELPQLTDFRVRIPPGGRTEALVETRISWGKEEEEGGFSTLGVARDQLAAAVTATEKMLNIVAPSRATTGAKLTKETKTTTAGKKSRLRSS